MNEADYVSGSADGCETVEEYRNALEKFMRRNRLFGERLDMKRERLGHELLKFVDGIVTAHDEMAAEVARLKAENVKLKTALWKIKNRNIEVDTMIGENDAYDCEVVYKDALYDIDKIASAALVQEASK